MIKIVVISNNTALEGFEKEHGLSLLIKVDNKVILFDTGNGSAFLNNIEKLSINYKEIDSLVLSHGHYDHCGNIDTVLKESENIKIYYHPDLTKERYSIHEDRDPKVKEIGLNEKNKTLLLKKESILTNKTTKIGPKTFITGGIPRLSFEDTGGPFFYDPEGIKVDSIPDDQSIWIETTKGLIIITGCCHSGIINTVEYIKKASHINKISGIIGGFHLSKATDSRVNKTIEYLNNLDLDFISPGHCTGEKVIDIFNEKLNCSVREFSAGIILDF